jgi:hypothetical protein
MRFLNINFSHLTGTLAAAGAIAGTIVNAADASHIHIPSAILSILISLAWLGQSPVTASQPNSATSSGASTSTSATPSANKPLV